MRYVYFDNTGRVDLAINDDTVSVLPEGAVELTPEQFNDRFNYQLVNGELVYAPLQAAIK